MPKIAIVTDSNSGITQAQAKELGVYVIATPFTIDGKEYFEDVSLSQEEFYQMLKEDKEVATSQPSVGATLDMWDKLLEEYDEVVNIPISSGLSGSCENSMGLATDYDGRVEVVDNQRVSATQRQAVLDAVFLAEQGKNAAEIKAILEEEKANSSIYIMVDTLKYLKKGGRVTAAAAAIGTVLNLKPVLQIHGEKLDAYAKVRGVKAAKKTMVEAIKKDIEEKFGDAKADKNLAIQVVHTQNAEAAAEFAKEVEAVFPECEIYIDRLSLSVACHIGPGSLALTYVKKLS
jgi:DegV family protein with EDD domain